MSAVLDKNKNEYKEWIDQWNFDSWAKNYDASVMDNTNDELKLFDGYEAIMDKLRGIIKENNSKKVLDIGCGTANLCGVLSEKLDITGMDQSIEMLILAQKKYPKIKFKFGNFLDMPFIEDFKSYAEFCGCNFYYEHLKNFTWLIEIGHI